MINRRALFGLGAVPAAAAVWIKVIAPGAQFATGSVAYANGFSVFGQGVVGEYIVPPHTYDAMRRLAAQIADLPMEFLPSMAAHRPQHPRLNLRQHP